MKISFKVLASQFNNVYFSFINVNNFPAPEGLDPPVLTVISTSSLRVSWTAPSKPNGEITSYRIILDGAVIDTVSTLPGSRVLNDLEPYTVYEIKVHPKNIFKNQEIIP